MTVYENMLMAAQERDGSISSRLSAPPDARATGDGRPDARFLGIDFLRGNLASALSYGQQKLLDSAWR